MKRPEPKSQTKEGRSTNIREGIARFFEGHTTLIIVFALVGVYVGVRVYADDEKHAQLRFVDVSSEQSSDLTKAAEARQFKPVFSGDPYETTLRLRESGALLIGVSLAAFEEFRVRGKFPATLGEILANLQKRSLLPPGVEIKDGTARSDLSALKVNYRTDPFSFEIFSFPIDRPENPTIMFRFPLPPGEANSIMYFQSSSGATPHPLAQFSTFEQLHAAGWSIRHWRGEALALDESSVRDLREQDAWLKSWGGK